MRKLLYTNLVLIALIAPLWMSSCSMLTLQQREEGMFGKRDTKEIDHKKVEETGSPALISKKVEINIDSEGDVTVHPPAPEKEENMRDVITAEILLALGKIKNTRNTDQMTTFEESVEISYYKKMSYIGGAFFLVVAFACILLVVALRKFRYEIAGWGLNPKNVGAAVTGMVKMVSDIKGRGFNPETISREAHVMHKALEKAAEHVTRELSSLTNTRSRNGMSEAEYSQIERSMMKFSELKAILSKGDSIDRHSYGN